MLRLILLRTHARRAAGCALSLGVGLAGAALLLALSVGRPAQGAPATIDVNPGESIQAAIDLATAGQTVQVNPGVYTESLTLNKAINLVGTNAATTFIHAAAGQRVITVTGAAVNANVTIADLTLQGGDIQGGTNCDQNCGGGMLITETAQPRLQNLIFRNNTAWQGGGLYAAANLTMTGGLFTNNTATGPGGGLHIQEMHPSSAEFQLVMAGTQFISNTAGGAGGGGAYVFGATVLNNGYFERNTCTGSCSGGGLETRELVMTDTVFLTNTSVLNGGGAYATVAATVSGGLFAGNRTGGYGGGLDLRTGLTLTGTKFISNTAQIGGGGLHTLFVDPANPVSVNGARFELNTCTFTNCNGGALMTASTLGLVVSDTNFLTNTSKGSGGAMYTGAVLTMTDGIFQENTCFSSGCAGGGLNAGDETWMSGTVFRHNTAQSGGGGAFFPGPARVTDAVFQDNACAGANCAGGGVHDEQGMAVTNTVFISNTSLGAGGGLAHIGAGDLRVVNSLFARNAAGAPGLALLFNVPGNGVVLHSTFANAATAAGAAVSVMDGSLGLTNTIIASYTVGISLTNGTAFEDATLFFNVATPRLGGVGTGSHHPTGNPLFVNPAADDYHLRVGSPAIDVGLNVGITQDIDGDPRPLDSGYDLGFDEFLLSEWRLHLPLVLK